MLCIRLYVGAYLLGRTFLETLRDDLPCTMNVAFGEGR